MIRKRFARRGLLAVAVVTAGLAVAPGVAAQTVGTEYRGAQALGLALRRVGTTERVLMIAAHPDDENTAVLAALALGRGADVAYLSLTRGDGGQNGIGPELQEAIGLIRSEELLAARRLDGAGQFFTRAYDYGFSKSADEAFLHWPRDSVLSDVVAVIRRFRPDIVVTVFGGTPSDGHGQHQAAGILARAAFEAAGDPSRFPEHLAWGLAPHRPAKLYHASWRGATEDAVVLETGVYDPLLGRSWHQIAAASRSRHRSQDMGRAEPAGPQRVRLQRLDAPNDEALFAGVDTSLVQRARSAKAPAAALREIEAYDDAAREARERYNPLRPGDLVPLLSRALGHLDRAEHHLGDRTDSATAALRFHISQERDDVRRALGLAAGVVVDAVASAERIVPGQTFTLELSVWNGGTMPLAVRSLEPVLPAGWTAEPRDPLPGDPLPAGEMRTRTFAVTVPEDAPATEPYYLRAPRDGDLYRWPDDPTLRGLPFEPREVRAHVLVALDGTPLPIEVEATYRHVTSTEGESRRPVRVVPTASVMLEPGVAVLPLGDASAKASRDAMARDLAFRVRVEAAAPEGVRGTLRLTLPDGWRAEPATVSVALTAPGESREVAFRVTPPAGVGAGEYAVGAVLETEDGKHYARGAEVVDYPHIHPRARYRDAAATVRALDVRVPTGLRVAYVPGAGDLVPEALVQLGLEPDLVDPAAIASTDLDAYDVVVLGIRAYEHRPELAANNRALLEYVERGGTLIVQYNQYRYSRGGLAPYPLDIARPHDRVTDETAPVRLLDPDHPALSWPNRITSADFEGWVQERGLYFPRTWDERYTPLLEMSDPGEPGLRGGLLVAKYGKGTYVYTGLAFFRQLPAGVPGAYRLFANLLALGADR